MKRTPLRKKRRPKDSLGLLKEKFWDIFSVWIRRRDANEFGMVKCISCPVIKHWKELQAGHYLPKSLGLSIYFEERNVHPQCVRCNYRMKGNMGPYAVALRKRYGETILEDLEALQREDKKILPYEYKEMIEIYKAKISSLDGFVFGARS